MILLLMEMEVGLLSDPHLKHMYDGLKIMDIYDQEITHLTSGVPGPDVLKKCIEIFQKATEDTMVIVDMQKQLVPDPHLKHLHDGEKTLNVYHPEVTNLSAGAPGPDVLKKCIGIFRGATAETLEREVENAYLFQYGITSGLWEFREELSKFLTARYGSKVYRENLILTCGASHGLQIILTTLLHPCGIIFLEEVTYMSAIDLFKQFTTITVIPVPMDDQGVIVDALEQIATAEKAKQAWKTKDQHFWSMFYTVTVYHNPTGITLPQERCISLVRMARMLDMLVVCDDVYNLLHYENCTAVPERLFAYDVAVEGYADGHVISNGSFSKILAPGVRVGWLEVSPRIALILRDSGYLNCGGGTNQYMAGLMRSVLQMGLEDKLLGDMLQRYKENMEAVCETLQQNLPPGCSFISPKGGYFVWVKTPKCTDMNEFVPWCQQKYKVTAMPGSTFSILNEFKNYLRISIAFHTKAVYVDAIQRLCNGLREYIELETLPSSRNSVVFRIKQ